MIKFRFFAPLALLFITLTNSIAQVQSADKLAVSLELINPSSEINDGVAKAEASGGQPPYQYKWSNVNTPLHGTESFDLIEGLKHSLTVTDAAGNEVSETFIIPAKSITEVFNSKVQPAVDLLGAVLFWDVFATLRLYDPVVYSSEKTVPLPRLQINDAEEYIVKKWLVEEGKQVEIGQEIALLESENEEKLTIYSPSEGTIERFALEGEVISRTPETGSFTAPLLAVINFPSPQPLLYPNGDVRTNAIPFIVIWLMLGSLFFTFRLKFINIRGFKHSINLARGKYDDPNAPGTITHFQAMATAVSATVGLGNIAGVAVAISLGGAGATFWMFLAGFFGMSLKFAECTLGVKYRHINEEGRVFGGPMNYLHYGLEKRNLKRLGKFLAVFFAVLGVGASFGGGNMLQSNQTFKILSEQIPMLQGQGFYFGIGFALLVGAVIIGGIKSIAKVTEKVVPIMAGFYIIGCIIVIGFHFEYLGGAFKAIYDGAFSADALKGGFIGVLILGLQRAAFSNEAGVGSAAIAHSPAKTNHPVADGFTSLVEPFIDTMLVCTMTALVLIFTGMHETSSGLGGVELTAEAFGKVISWFPTVLAVAVFLFAFSTMVSWSYYGMRSWTYLFGKSKKGEMVYKLLYLVFVVIGSSVSLGAVLDFADMMILAMSFPNIIGLYIMAPEINADMQIYWQKLKNNELYINPKFIKSKA